MPNATEEQVVALIEAAQKEVLNNTYHAYFKMCESILGH